jgi:hypothetical protein
MRRGIFMAVFVFTVFGSPAQLGADAAPQTALPTEGVTVTGHALLDNPDGKGDPDEIACRKPQQLPGSRLMAQPVCKSNRDWAQVRKDGNDVSPDGRSITASQKSRTLNPVVCQPAAAPPGASGMTTYDFNPSCFRWN